MSATSSKRESRRTDGQRCQEPQGEQSKNRWSHAVTQLQQALSERLILKDVDSHDAGYGDPPACCIEAFSRSFSKNGKRPRMRYRPWNARSGRRIIVAGARIEGPEQDWYTNYWYAVSTSPKHLISNLRSGSRLGPEAQGQAMTLSCRARQGLFCRKCSLVTYIQSQSSVRVLLLLFILPVSNIMVLCSVAQVTSPIDKKICQKLMLYCKVDKL